MAAAARHRLPLLDPRHPLAAAEDVFLFLRLRLGASDGAALPLRPADAARLEGLPAAQSHLRRPRLRLSDADQVRMIAAALLMMIPPPPPNLGPPRGNIDCLLEKAGKS